MSLSGIILDMKKFSSYFKNSQGKFAFPKLKLKTRDGRWDKKRLLNYAIRLVAGFVALIALVFIVYAHDLPDPNKVLTRAVPQSTKIYARDGSLLYEVHGEFKRTLIPYDQMNENVRHATIAIEDKDFYNESGINFKGILRSIWVNITSGSKSQGGSTITQQFVRNALLSREKSFSRKIKEIILSLEINRKFSKDDILKLYLNEIPYGRNAYGIQAAAQVYFNKDAKNLSLAEAAYLAALPQSPSYLSPTGAHRDQLDYRKNLVLDKMAEQGYISEQQRDDAKNTEVVFQKAKDYISAPNFVLYITDYLTQKYGEEALQNGGLLVTTSLDPKLQAIAEKVVADGVVKNQGNRANNAALVAIDPKTGQILAMVGSKNYFGEPEPKGCKPGINCTFEPNVNVAIAERQAGSSMKPYVYATAFKPEFAQAPATMRVDVLTNFGIFGGKAYIPKNFNGQVHGPVSIRQALAGSLNIPAVKTLALVGVDAATQTMRDSGITSPLKDCGLSLVLGGCEVELIDHVSGYSTFAAMGVHHEKTGILKIEDNTGRILEEYKDQSRQVIDPQSVYELISIMTDNASRQFTFGSSSQNLILPDRIVAAKTGTTQNFKDGWTLGFTPSLVAGVWTGNNDGTLMRTDAVITAAPIWKSFMQQATAGTPPEEFPVPAGIQKVTVDALSGLLPGPYTPATKEDVFASFSVPKEKDNTHIYAACAIQNPEPSLQMPDQQNQDPNNPNPQPDEPPQPACSPGIYTFFHSEKPNDPNWEGPVIAWVQSHYGAIPPGSTVGGTPEPNPGQTSDVPPTVTITSPRDNAKVDGSFTLQTTISPDSGNTISRVDFLVDGSIIQSVKGSASAFAVSGLSSGDHTIAVHAVDSNNNSGDDSITVKVK